MRMNDILYDFGKYIAVEVKETKKGTLFYKIKVKGFSAEKALMSKGYDSIMLFCNDNGVTISPQTYQYFNLGQKTGYPRSSSNNTGKRVLAFRRAQEKVSIAFTITGKPIIRYILYKRKKRNPIIFTIKKDRADEMINNTLCMLTNEIQSEQFGYEFCIGLNRVHKHIINEITYLINSHLTKLKGENHGHFFVTK